LGAFFSFLVLITGRIAEMIVIKRSQSKSLRYNLVRAIRLLTAIFILVVIISFVFQNWYTAAVSLGLISLILGFALQVPISSFIAWLYIIFRTPYRVGDRIEISQFRGDVVEIGYLDTTLWEFGGNYLTNDMPSGRLIRFPNSMVLQSAVFNYSWPKFPYIWNEIPFHIAYESDLEFVEKTLKKITKTVLSPQMADRINDLKELVKQTPVDELQIKEYPFVSFRINPNTWVEVLVTYLVEPKQATAVRSRIIKQAIAALLAEPDKVMFPKSNSR
jgi:small-conductance mechanosensitive channel